MKNKIVKILFYKEACSGLFYRDSLYYDKKCIGKTGDCFKIDHCNSCLMNQFDRKEINPPLECIYLSLNKILFLFEERLTD